MFYKICAKFLRVLRTNLDSANLVLMRQATNSLQGCLRVVRLLPLEIMLLSVILPSSMVRAEESGTLVVIGKTSTAAFLTVDSRITHTNPPSPPTFHNAPERKLFEVGKRGACAIEAWTGDEHVGVALSDRLRQIAQTDPNKNTDQLFDNLLSASAKTWDEMDYPLSDLPNGRKPGSKISELLCIDFIKGKPKTILGVTEVISNGKASSRRLPEECHGWLYIAGFMDMPHFVGTVENPPSAAYLYGHPDGTPATEYENILKDFSANNSAMSAFFQWEKTSKVEVNKLGQSNQWSWNCPGANLSPPWELTDAQSFTQALLTAVETYDETVGGP